MSEYKLSSAYIFISVSHDFDTLLPKDDKFIIQINPDAICFSEISKTKKAVQTSEGFRIPTEENFGAPTC